jgi:type VI protein secretion system component VasK
MLLATENTTFPKHPTSAVQQVGQAGKKVGRGLDLFGKKQGGAGGPVTKALGDLLGNGSGEDEIAEAFQPAHEVFEKSPPNHDRWNDARNTPYLASLGAIQRAVEALSRDGRCDETNLALNNAANAEITKAQEAIDGLARSFDNKGVYENVKALLESPLPGVRKLVIIDPGDSAKRKISAAQQQLCGSLDTIKNKYPFLPGAKDEAGLADVSRVFGPKDGALAVLRQTVSDLSVRLDGNWSQKPDTAVRLSPGFWVFLNRMSEISAVLFPSQGTARYKFSLQPSAAIKQVTGTIDGEPISGSREYSWPPSNGEINLRVEPTGGGSTPLCSYSGLWAIFRLLSGADHRVGTSLYPLVYLKAEGAGSLRQPILPDHSPVIFEVMQYPNNVRQAFDKDFFVVSCPKRIFE